MQHQKAPNTEVPELWLFNYMVYSVFYHNSENSEQTVLQLWIWIYPQEEIEQVILVGGSTRVPKVQEVLLKAVGK